MLSGLRAAALLVLCVFVAATATDARYSIQDLQHDSDVDIAKSTITGGHSLRRRRRGATSIRDRVWEQGIIPYEIESRFNSSQIALFKKAMQYWESKTCIQFIERDLAEYFNIQLKRDNYLLFTYLPCECCTAMIGRPKKGPLKISISENCQTMPIALHELGHVIGFHHEQQRPDRDKYVRVNTRNLLNGVLDNFEIVPEIDSLGQPYDFGSIMHYYLNEFVYNKDKLSMDVLDKVAAKPYEGLIGQAQVPSHGDIVQANLLYKCPKCGQTLLDGSGALLVPKAAAGKWLACEWRIAVQRDQRIVLRLNELSVASNCNRNYVEVRDGFWFGAPVIAHLCGNSMMPVELRTTGNRMLITLRTQPTEEAAERPPFAATYATVGEPQKPIR